MRVLVTGSRAHPKPYRIASSLDQTYWEWLHTGEEQFVVVHGACPTGADAVASRWVREHIDDRVVEEKHVADWRKGKAAGPRRNKEMVESGIDLVLAFPHGESRGTRGTIAMAERRGLTIILHN